MENSEIVTAPISTASNGAAVRTMPAANSSGTARARSRGRPFVPGTSGNPRGRPRRDQDIAELARTHTAAAIETLVGVMRDAEAPPSARITAASALLDRGWGKAPQSIALRQEISFSDQFEQFIRELGTGRLAAE